MNIFNKDKKDPESLKDVLARFEELKIGFEKISEELEAIKKENKFSVQKVGVLRYNPFSGQGGDQSFTVALLDANNDGVVITSIYSREGSRVYAKPINKGISEYALSSEEKKAMEKIKGS
jgi:hypothetical protein